MFYRVGFQIVQGASAKADAIERFDHASRQVSDAAMFDVFRQLAAGRQREFVRRLRRLSDQSAPPQGRFQPAIHFHHRRLFRFAPAASIPTGAAG